MSFVITDQMDVSGSIDVSVVLAALSSGTLFLEQETSPGVWETVASDPYSMLVGAVGTVASLDLGALALDEGTYRVRVTLTSTLVSTGVSVTTDVDVTYLDQFEIETSTGDNGNLLDNDEPGSEFTTVQIFDADLGSFVEIPSGSPVTVQGTYGTLTVDAGATTPTPPIQLPHTSIRRSSTASPINSSIRPVRS
ncbi:hypothetical protein [Neoaquamicrobium sediminum]|uniref:hypothetical protein n=1 Tax=Neoaquamicrobium sediminum TaxID=1849104 RepID=UPI0015661A64|nr:hypothetical protein [Mesorhizobium sediminum]NRC54627.1 hypothetical protein [Mesorhizobium sediminum]